MHTSLSLLKLQRPPPLSVVGHDVAKKKTRKAAVPIQSQRQGSTRTGNRQTTRFFCSLNLTRHIGRTYYLLLRRQLGGGAVNSKKCDFYAIGNYVS